MEIQLFGEVIWFPRFSTRVTCVNCDSLVLLLESFTNKRENTIMT
jgi:hypothetical protein